MNSNKKNYDVSLTNSNNLSGAELIEIKTDYLNLNTTQASSTIEFCETNDKDGDFNSQKVHFNNSLIGNNHIASKKEHKKVTKYRKGKLHTFFYDKNGNPRIVIGPDCKFVFINNLT